MKNKVFNALIIFIAASLVIIKLYHSNSHFSRVVSRELLDEYRNTFEYNLSQDQLEYWTKVITNYDLLSSDQKKILSTYLSKEEELRVKKTISAIAKIIKTKYYWTSQSVKEDVIYFTDLNIYEYLHSLQSPKLEEAKNNRGKYANNN